MNDRVAAGERLLDNRGVTQIALDLDQLRMVLHRLKDVVAVNVKIEDRDRVPGCEQFRHQHRADIAGSAGHQNMPLTLHIALAPIELSASRPLRGTPAGLFGRLYLRRVTAYF